MWNNKLPQVANLGNFDHPGLNAGFSMKIRHFHISFYHFLINLSFFLIFIFFPTCRVQNWFGPLHLVAHSSTSTQPVPKFSKPSGQLSSSQPGMVSFAYFLNPFGHAHLKLPLLLMHVSVEWHGGDSSDLHSSTSLQPEKGPRDTQDYTILKLKWKMELETEVRKWS